MAEICSCGVCFLRTAKNKEELDGSVAILTRDLDRIPRVHWNQEANGSISAVVFVDCNAETKDMVTLDRMCLLNTLIELGYSGYTKIVGCLGGLDEV